MIGLCTTHKDPDLWFPEGEPSVGRPTRAEHHRKVERALTAISICQTCPVRAQCLAEGMKEENIEYGIWGGLLAGERIKLARTRKTGSAREQAIVFAEGVRAWATIS